MDRKIFLSLAVIISSISLTACGHEHVWSDATCTTPKTCIECSEIEGEAIGHVWVDADCETAKHCSVCSETQGEPLGHKWTEATCTTAKVCDVCNKVEGEPAGHEWIEATCTSPKNCIKCLLVEGEPTHHKWIEATTEKPKTCESCGQTEGNPLPKQNKKTASNNSSNYDPSLGISESDWNELFGGTTSGGHTWTPDNANPNYSAGINDKGGFTISGHEGEVGHLTFE